MSGRCPRGFCRDAEHCLTGGRCADAVGELLPVQLVEVTENDLLLDQLGAGAAPDPKDDTRILAAWRDSVRADSVRELVDVDTALAAIQAGCVAVAGRRRRVGVVSLVGTAIAVVLIAWGRRSGWLATRRGRGTCLCPVQKLLYDDHRSGVVDHLSDHRGNHQRCTEGTGKP